jgi:hypothetical protein
MAGFSLGLGLAPLIFNPKNGGLPAGFGYFAVKQNDGSFAPFQVQTAAGYLPLQVKVS